MGVLLGLFAALSQTVFITVSRGRFAGIPSVQAIEPLVGVTLAAVLLHEGLMPIQVLGGAAILTAALLLQREAPTVEPERVVVPVAERH